MGGIQENDKKKGYEHSIDLGLILFHIGFGVGAQMRIYFYSKTQIY